MTIRSIKYHIYEFYKQSDKVSFWFAIVMFCRLFGFIHLPVITTYIGLILYAFYVFIRGGVKFCTPLLMFVLYIPIQLITLQPNAIFRSWERFVLFSSLLICVSPLMQSGNAVRFRKITFFVGLFSDVLIGVGSFVGKFVGINYMVLHVIDLINNVGYFGGLTTHSMTLGPVAGIGAITLAYLGLRTKDKIYWVLGVMCLGAVLFSASRSALLATIGGLIILFYQISGSNTKFLKTLVPIVLLGIISFPFWENSLDPVLQKNKNNIQRGSMLSSREALWDARIAEFKSSPLLGVGFAAVDTSVSGYSGGVNENNGQVESGSSWFIILSMTGIIGVLLLIPVFVKAFLNSYKGRDPISGLVCGVLTLFFIHMMAEGYIYYGGGTEAFMFWLVVGVAYNITDNKVSTNAR